MKIKVINYGYKKLPIRQYYNDAGADIHINLLDQDFILINPQETVKIPLGLGLDLPDGLMGLVMPRSGLSCRGLVCEVVPIDSGYKGEIHAIVHNQGNEIIRLNNGDRVGQLVIIPIILADFIDSEVTIFERQNNAFGSTGIK